MYWTKFGVDEPIFIDIRPVSARELMKAFLITICFGFAYLLQKVAPDALTLVSQFYVLFGAIVLGSFVLIISGVQTALGKSDKERSLIIWNSIINAIISVPITLGMTFFTMLILHALVNYYLNPAETITVFQTWQATLAVGMFWMLFGFGFRSMGS